MIFGRKTWPEQTQVNVEGKLVAISIRPRAGSRRYRLSLSHTGDPILGVPEAGRWAEALAFLNRHNDWLAKRLRKIPTPVPFIEGAEIPFKGKVHIIGSTGSVRGRVQLSNKEELPGILVPGLPQHLSRRLTDWFKSEARREFEVRTSEFAEKLDVEVSSIQVRGQSSRWGSCSSAKRLSYNWRLILTPPFVLDYVVAHEVAHLVEMNHSKAFWKLVAYLQPEMETGRTWLKTNGEQLMAYGVTPTR